LACSTDSIYPTYSVEIIQGQSQVGLEGEYLSEPIVIEVKDSEDQPVKGLKLSLKIESGKGTINVNNLQTDSDGLASVNWKLGSNWTNSLRIFDTYNPKKYTIARAISRYKYEIPIKLQDGWEVGDIGTTLRQPSDLIDVIEEIRKENYTGIDALLVVSKGTIVLEKYWPGKDSNGSYILYDHNTPHEQQSASKSFRAALMGIAIDQGYINSTKDRIFDYFPKLQHLSTEEKSKITVGHILEMTSGLAWKESGNGSDLSQMYSLPFQQWHEYVLSRPMMFDPGTTFIYNTGASIMMNRTIENASDRTIAEFTREYFMDATESTLLPGNANLQAKKLPRDMAKLGQIYLDSGRWKKNRIISKEWISRCLEPRSEVLDRVNTYYGYQWWIREYISPKSNTPYNIYYASGNGGQLIFVIYELDIVVVFTGSNYNSALMNQPFEILEERIIPAFE
jgi:CubicO group peptidase (beta-lactamase class C family)